MDNFYNKKEDRRQKKEEKSNEDARQRMIAFQDVNVMTILGFGFLFGFLKKFGFSAVAFNLLITALGIQWAIIVDAFLFHRQNGMGVVDFSSLCTGLMGVVPVLISSGVVLGKVNPVQLIIMTAIEVTMFTVNRYIMASQLMIEKQVSMIHAHIFGAYFGLAVSWLTTPPTLSNEINKEKEKSESTSELFSMLGTLFMWMFWPSYNSVWLQTNTERRNAVYNTYFSLAVCTVTVFSLSMLTNRTGKLKMTHIRNAVLAGGVSIGFSAYAIQYPWITMTIGLLAGLISTLSFQYLQGPLNTVSLVHDTCGVHYTFGLPGVLGGISYVLVILMADFSNIGILGYKAVAAVGCICLTLAVSLVSGIITGFLLKCKLLKPPKEWHFFHDQPYWEFPHLASHL
ncbi:blood group Rh(CE) polypeptide [Rhinophrynus dorsalis]